MTLGIAIALTLPLVVSDVRGQGPAARLPIIDVHLHAYGAAHWKGTPSNPVTGKPGPASAEEHMRQTLMLANGLGKRIMFGTDQMRWPDTIGMAIDAIQSSKALNDEQRRDILYDNAARFLRLDEPRVGVK